MIPTQKFHQGDEIIYKDSPVVIVDTTLAETVGTGEYSWAYKITWPDCEQPRWVNEADLSESEEAP